MEINWFTFVAQIINFLILVFLLQKFLYQPILKVINQRKNKIKGQLFEAEEQFFKAKQQEQKYLDLTKELETKKQEFLDQANTEAQAEKTRLLKLIKNEVEDSKNRWQLAIKQEQEIFLQGLRHQVGKELFSIMKKAFNDLANVELEAHILNVFLENLGKIDREKQTKIIKNLQHHQEIITIQTGFEISEEKQSEMIEQIHKIFNYTNDIKFERSDDLLLCGINLIVGGEELSWSLDSYLENLEENLKIALEF